jgi:hypothetical protein
VEFRYDTSYQPPAPVVEVIIVSATENVSVGPLPALVDSGPDGTLVPLDYLLEIRAPVTVEMSIRSQWGERRRMLLYLVDVRLGRLTLPGIEVVGDELSNEIVLGRDVLNRMRVLLNGPAQAVQVSE